VFVSKAQPIKVLVVDQRPLVRGSLSAAIEAGNGFEAEASQGVLSRVLERLDSYSFDVVLFGISAIDVSVSLFVRSVLNAHRSVAIVALVLDSNDKLTYEALEAGAAGFVTAETSLEDLQRQLRAAAAQQTILPPEFVIKILSQAGSHQRKELQKKAVPDLTSREHEIFALLTKGLSNAEIAVQLGVSTNTVKNHLYNIYRKLGVSTRSQAFAVAAKLGVAV